MLTAYKLLKFFFRYIVPPPLRYPLARFSGRVVVFFNAKRRHILVSNLTPLLGSAQARRVAPIQMGHFGMTAVDFFCPPKGLIKRVEMINAAALEKTYRKARKAIVVTAHVGNWELGISCLLSRGFPVAGLYAPYREDDVVQWILAHRNQEVEWIPSSKGAAQACIDVLRRGSMLGIVGDIPYGERGRRVMIAGHSAHLPLGPWAIAARAEAPVIPAFMRRLNPGHYEAVFHEPIWPKAGSLRHQMESMQDVYRLHLEAYLQRYPEQWGVLEAFWG